MASRRGDRTLPSVGREGRDLQEDPIPGSWDPRALRPLPSVRPRVPGHAVLGEETGKRATKP